MSMRLRDNKLIEQQTAALQCAYLDLASFTEKFDRSQRKMLGAVCFTPLASHSTVAASGAPLAHVAMPALDVAGSANSTCEVWGAEGAFTYGHRDALRYGHNEEILFGVIQLSEADFETSAVRDAGRSEERRVGKECRL